VASAVLSKIEDSQYQVNAQDVGMTDQAIQELTSKVGSMSRDAFNYAEKRGMLSGKLESQPKHHKARFQGEAQDCQT
jgi:hypothetical protein